MGTGKIILTSIIIDEIQQQHLGALAFFYFTFRERDAQDLFCVKHAIPSQLVRHLTREDAREKGKFHMPQAFCSLCDKYSPSGHPTLEDLDKTLAKVLGESAETYIFIDAMDECPSPSDQADVISLLASLSHRPQPNIHVLMTSRREGDIDTAIRGLPGGTVTTLSLASVQVEIDKDIKNHILENMKREPYRSWSSNQQTKVVNALSSRAGGSFRWACLQLEELREKPREIDIDRALSQLPGDLQETYERILQRIASQPCHRNSHAGGRKAQAPA